jgi:gluconate kinase
VPRAAGEVVKAVYVLGGAGTGKSTFTAAVVEALGAEFGPLKDLHAKENKKNVVTLRGHDLITPYGGGLYLGRMREQFPGTDGLDRASSPAGVEWLTMVSLGLADPVRFVLAEGATLATSTFLDALRGNSDLLVFHLTASPEETRERFIMRGSSQDPKFVAATVTRSRNRAEELRRAGAQVLDVDTEDSDATSAAVTLAFHHLTGEAR